MTIGIPCAKLFLSGIKVTRINGVAMKKREFILILGMISMFLSGCDIQQRLIYYPGEVRFYEIQQYAVRAGLKIWPENNETYQAVVSLKGPGKSKGTIVVFHGNAGPAVFRKYYIAALEGRGYRVVLAEYPGYGGRPGEMSEESFVADARLVALRAKKEFGDPIYVWGESLGCGVASALASDAEVLPKGVVMLTPWDSLPNLAKVKFPWLPVGFFIRDMYDNVANLEEYKGPVAVIMAKRDEIIPNRLTERFYELLPQPKRRWIFENAGHNDWPNRPELGWWDEVMDFLNQTVVR